MYDVRTNIFYMGPNKTLRYDFKMPRIFNELRSENYTFPRVKSITDYSVTAVFKRA